MHGNKGKKHSEIARQNMSNAHMGNKPSEETRLKMGLARTGEKNPNYKKNFSEETRLKMSNAKMGKRGKKSNAYKNGSVEATRLIRRNYKYVKWRQDCFVRDDFTCQKCGQRGVALEVHHIKPFITLLFEAKGYMPLFTLYEAALFYTPLWDVDNGITLCTGCHKKTEHSWKINMVKEKING